MSQDPMTPAQTLFHFSEWLDSEHLIKNCEEKPSKWDDKTHEELVQGFVDWWAENPNRAPLHESLKPTPPQPTSMPSWTVGPGILKPLMKQMANPPMVGDHFLVTDAGTYHIRMMFNPTPGSPPQPTEEEAGTEASSDGVGQEPSDEFRDWDFGTDGVESDAKEDGIVLTKLEQAISNAIRTAETLLNHDDPHVRMHAAANIMNWARDNGEKVNF